MNTSPTLNASKTAPALSFEYSWDEAHDCYHCRAYEVRTGPKGSQRWFVAQGFGATKEEASRNVKFPA